MKPTAVVFLGPTLPVGDASRLVHADFLPPARQGDIYRAVKRFEPAVIGVIDGNFHHAASIWHREILWAMTQGIHVLGAASMGALRAAELHTYGMVGVGRIFEAYRDGRFPPYQAPFEDDDEVAVTHGPPETDFVLLSEALVDIRDALASAANAGVISIDTRDSLVSLGKGMSYRERSIERLAGVAASVGVAPSEIEALQAWLPGNRRSLKQNDAICLLREISRLLADFPGAFVASFHFEHSSAWNRFEEQQYIAWHNGSEMERTAIQELRWRPAEWRDSLRQAMLRRIAITQALANGTVPSQRDVRASLDRLRRSFGLLTRESLEVWSADNGLDEADLMRLLREEAIIDLLVPKDADGLADMVADHLRLTGRFAQLVARSAAKRRWAEEAGLAGKPPSSVELADLIDVFVSERLEQYNPSTAEALAARLGFRDLDAFIRDLYLELTYSRLQAPTGAE